MERTWDWTCTASAVSSSSKATRAASWRAGTSRRPPRGFGSCARQHELPAERPWRSRPVPSPSTPRGSCARGAAAGVIDAHEVRVKAHRPPQKSDRRDAFELCEGLRRGIYRAIVHVPPARIGALRETLSRRRHFVRCGPRR